MPGARCRDAVQKACILLDPGGEKALYNFCTGGDRALPAVHPNMDWQAMETTAEILAHLKVEGYCVIEGVIPPARVGTVRQRLAACLRAARATTEKSTAAVRARGHRIGAAGVQALPGIINYDQSFAPYLTEARIIGAVEALFGPHYRIATNSAMANHPGNARGYWHADWPFNQTNAAHIPAPYGGAPIKLSSLWMLSEFSPHTGGTLVVPGSHRAPINPSGGAAFDREAPHPSELQIAGPAGSVMLFDSRLWHCVATNHSDAPRVAMNIGYAPWWLNLEPTRKGSPEYQAMVVETGGKPNETPLIPAPVFAALPTQVQALVRHWVA